MTTRPPASPPVAIQLLLVPAHANRPASPDLDELLRRGWKVLKIRPRVTLAGSQFFVVLGKPHPRKALPREKVAPPRRTGRSVLRNAPILRCKEMDYRLYENWPSARDTPPPVVKRRQPSS